MRVIDLFSGCGGFSIGFAQAGFAITKAVEIDRQIAESYQKNHPGVDVIVDDIGLVKQSGQLKKGDCDIMVGGPPCQGFSMAGSRIRHNFVDDPRNHLFKHYSEVVQKVKPKAFIMENVKGITTMEGGEIFKEIVRTFESFDDGTGDYYSIGFDTVKASDFGVPQSRERVIITGILNKEIKLDEEIVSTKEDMELQFPNFFDRCSVWDAISNLGPPTKTGVVENLKPESAYQKYLSCPAGRTYNHVMTNHSSQAIRRMKKIGNGENYTKLDETINSVHSGSYGRLEQNGLARTITTRFDTPSGGMYTHPLEDRTLTPREAARIQSIPDTYEFTGTKTSICTQIGNAVPPKIAFFLANMVKRVIHEDN